MGKYQLQVFGGNSNPELTKEICQQLDITQGEALVTKFSDGESRVEIENARGNDVFVIQTSAHPVNDTLMELLVIIDALKRASAKRITAVIPLYFYARQDRKNKPGVPISAKLAADLITVAGAHRVLTMDLHAGQIQGFFNIPVDNLYGSPILLPYIRENYDGNLVIVAPDAGGTRRAAAYAKRLKVSMALIDKRRSDVNKAEALHLIGRVKGKTALILDDMVDTAGTLIEATRTLLKRGAIKVIAITTHAVFSGPAITRINNSDITRVVVTDTSPLNNKAKKCDKITVLPAGVLFAKAISNIHEEESISSLFEIKE